MLRRPTTVNDARVQMALECVTEGIEAADPKNVVDAHISMTGTHLVVDSDRFDLASYDDVLVVGGGNAAGVLTGVLEKKLGKWISDGAIVTDNPVGTDIVDELPGDHPVPSGGGVESTRELLALAEGAEDGDLVIVVITGGGSALMSAPADGINLEALQQTTEALLTSGADIDEINAVRKHCSAIKGGRLAQLAAPATVLGIVVSDVIGNRLDVIASGPLFPDDSTFKDALVVLDRYDINVKDAVWTRLNSGLNGEYPETPSAGNPVFKSIHHYVIANGMTALRGAAAAARRVGYEPVILSARIRGEARDVARTLVGIAEQCATTGTPVEPPAVLLTGGETTVTVNGEGTGGPNQEFTLSAAIELQSADVIVASVDTDGIDGQSEAAGGVATMATAEHESAARAALMDNDAFRFLDQRDSVIITGPTNTNVNDLRAFVIADAE